MIDWLPIGIRGSSVYFPDAISSIFQMKNIDPTEIFSTLSNPVRLRCLCLIATVEDVCVCEIEESLQIAQPAASKALNALKTAGIVTARRQANWNYYCLAADLPDWLREIVRRTVEELSSHKPFQADRNRLAKLNVRPTACS
jgi:ArsR family transcriptional regulator